MTIYINPYRRLAGLREVMDRMIEESINDQNNGEREMALGVNVAAEDDGYTLTALVPGLEAEDLDIEILNNTVTIRGEFKDTAGDEKTRFITRELPAGRFTRAIALPVALDAAKVEAALKNGVLTLRIPKAEAHRPKAIKINAG